MLVVIFAPRTHLYPVTEPPVGKETRVDPIIGLDLEENVFPCNESKLLSLIYCLQSASQIGLDLEENVFPCNESKLLSLICCLQSASQIH